MRVVSWLWLCGGSEAAQVVVVAWLYSPTHLSSRVEPFSTIADKVAIYSQEPFDAELKEYGKRQSETHEQYCNRLLMKSEELREQALEEDKEAANVEAEVIPQIVCDYQWCVFNVFLCSCPG